MSTFGDWTNPHTVRVALRDFAVKWMPEYVAEAERQFGIDPHSVPIPGEGQFVFRRDEFEKWPEEQMPVVLIVVPGLIAELRRETDRSLTAPVGVSFGVMTSSGGHPDDAAEESAMILGTALKQLFNDLPPEGLKTDGKPVLMDERYGDIPFAKQRDLGSARLIYRLWIRDWVTKGRPPGPNPRPDPYEPSGERPRVETTHHTITTRRIGE